MGFGFLGDGSLGRLNNAANGKATELGAIDAFAKAPGVMGGVANPAGIPGSNVLGPIGGALAALGLANDIADMSKRGINAENGLDALGNGLGVGAWLAGSTPAGLLMGAGAGGMAVGNASNNFIADTGVLGKNVDRSSRNWSDMAADWGTAADEAVGGGALGTAAGLGATVAGSVVGTGGAIATSGLALADSTLELGAAGIDAAGDAWNSFWD